MIVFLSRNHDADNDHTERQQIVGVEKGTLNKHGRPCLGVFRGKIRTRLATPELTTRIGAIKMKGMILERLHLMRSIFSNLRKCI